MKDVRKEVYQALDGALSCPVHFLSPPAGAQEPCVSFFELNNADTLFADDEPQGSSITYAVDLWSAKAGEIPALAQRVDAAMQSIGFARISAQDLPPDEAGLYHKNMQYAMLA